MTDELKSYEALKAELKSPSKIEESKKIPLTTYNKRYMIKRPSISHTIVITTIQVMGEPMGQNHTILVTS